MPPIKFQLHPTYHSGTDVVSRFSSWLPWRPPWLLEWNEFSISKSPCHPNASHHVWAQSHLPCWSRRGLKIFKMATMAASWILERNDFSNSESLCCSDTSHQVSAKSYLWFGRRYRLKIFNLGYWNRMVLAILIPQNSPSGPNASHQVWAQSDLGFRSRCGFKIFKRATQAAILDGRTE